MVRDRWRRARSAAVETLHIVPLEDDQGLVDKASELARGLYGRTKSRLTQPAWLIIFGGRPRSGRAADSGAGAESKWFRGGEDWFDENGGEPPGSLGDGTRLTGGWELLHLPMLKEELYGSS